MKIFLDKTRFRVYIVYMQYRQYEQLKAIWFQKGEDDEKSIGFCPFCGDNACPACPGSRSSVLRQPCC